MKTNLYNLIVISPHDPQIWKVRISRRAVLVLAIAFFLSLCVTIVLAQGLQNQTLSEADYRKLEAENRTMKIENRNAHLRTRKLDSELARLEEASKRITLLLESD